MCVCTYVSVCVYVYGGVTKALLGDSNPVLHHFSSYTFFFFDLNIFLNFGTIINAQETTKEYTGRSQTSFVKPPPC